MISYVASCNGDDKVKIGDYYIFHDEVNAQYITPISNGVNVML